MEKKRSLTFFLILLFIVGTLPITNPVSADGEVDNWPENDAWLRIELISWSANDSVEWDNNGGLPDPIFKICVEADGDNLDCINTPTWENQLTLNNSWNYSMDIPDNSNILNITIECEDNDALNDDECDMNSDVNYWRLYAEYNWSATPSLTISGDGDDDDDVTWKNAASTWKFSIDGYGDEDGDGISDNADLCPNTPENSNLLNHSFYYGCDWSQLDFDADGLINQFDQNPYNADYSVANTSASFEEWAAVSSAPIPTTSSRDCNSGYNCGTGIGKFLLMEFEEELGIRSLPNFYSNGQAFVENICRTDGSCDWYAQGQHSPASYPYYVTDIDYNGIPDFIAGNTFLQGSIENGNLILTDNDNLLSECRGIDSKNTFWVPADLDNDGLIEVIAVAKTGTQYSKICSTNPNSTAEHISLIDFDFSCDDWDNFDTMFEKNTGLHVIKCGNEVFWINGSLGLEISDNILDIIQMNFTIDTNSNSAAKIGGDFADLNNDGFVDLLLGSDPITTSQFNCEVYFGSVNGFSNGFLIDSLQWSSGDEESKRNACEGRVEILDLDGDGDLDIASRYCYTENTGDSFVPYCGSSSENYHNNFQFYDIDRDGDLDRITASDTSFQIFYNPTFIDLDQDGVDDNDDLCLNTQSGQVVNDFGCSQSELDDDIDGVFNDVDLCPMTSQNAEINTDGCSDEQLDDDGDGLNNALDQCPDTPQGDSVNLLGCSFEDSQDLDSDDDGVLDSDDACPNTPADVTVDSIGCDLDGNQTADTDSDGDGVYDSQDECANTPAGATADFKGCPMDSDYDGVYDGIDECPSSNNPAPSDMDKSSEVDSTGCFVDAAEGESDSGSAVLGCFWVVLMIGLVVFIVRKVRSPKQEQVFYAQPQPVIAPVQQQSVPIPQVSSRERQLEHQSRQAQIEAQRLRQQLANQAQITQQLQSEAAQKQMSDAALAEKQHELAVAQQEKEELEAKLAEAEKNTPIVQNITYNIQDSAISGDITNKINRNDLE